MVVFATGDKHEASHVSQHSSIAILAVEAEQRVFMRELIRRQISANGSQALAELRSIVPVPAVAETAEPTFNCAPAIPLFSS